MRQVDTVRRRPGRDGEGGYAMAALIVALTVMLIGMSVAAPSWRYLVKDMKEEELIFRGGQIADAIERYQARNGNAVPLSLDVLVKGRYLRKRYEDPMTEDGEWRLIRFGEPIVPGHPRPTPGTVPGGGATGLGTGPVVGGIFGVASKSTEEGLRLFNGRSRYDEWVFAPGQPRVVGAPRPGPVPPGQPGAGPAPGSHPTPAPSRSPL